MPYGIIKVDTVTFTNDGVDKSVTLSGLVQNPTFSGNVTVTGTLSGVTVTGTTANFTSGNFTNISGGTHTITSGVFAAGSAASPSITFTGDLNTGIYSPGADQVAISTGGTGRVFVDASGNVGITESSPSSYPAGAGIPNIVLKGSSATYPDRSGALTFLSQDTTTAKTWIYHDTDFYIQNTTATNIRFLTNNAERLRITSAGLVGINTSSPDALLTVNGVGSFGAGSATAPSIAFTGDLNTGIYSPGADQVAISTGGSGRLFVDASGRVSIGTTSPVEKLEVRDGNIGLDSAGSAVGDRTTERFYKRTDDGSTNGMAAIGMNGAGTNGFLGEIKFYTGASDVFSTSLSERLRIDSSGKLLVGTSTNISSLASLIQSASASTSNAFEAARFSNSAFGPRFTFCKSRGASVGVNALVADGDEIGSIYFNAANGSTYTNAARIEAIVDGVPDGSFSDMPGRLVFSTTADGASSPTERMKITQSGEIYVRCISGAWNFSANNASAADTTSAFYQGRYNATDNTGTTGTRSYVVWTNGNVQNTNNSYTAISDIKLKENIVDANSQWADIKSLQVRNYNLKEGQTHRQIGLIAQEVEPISPGLVYESPDRDADGNDLGTVTKSVNYSVLYMKAVKALQEAMERIETLEARLTAAGI